MRRRHICYSGAPPIVLTYLSNHAINSVSNTHTHTGVAFGAADPKRAIIVCLTCNANNVSGITGVTIGGVAATRAAIGQTSTFTNAFTTEIWIASVPTGTSGDVVITRSGGGAWSSDIGVYSVIGLKSLIPTATAFARDAYALPTSVAVQGGGIVISSAYQGSSSQTSASWVGCTQDFYARFNTDSSGSHTCGQFFASSPQTLNVNTTFPAGTLNCVSVTASFR